MALPKLTKTKYPGIKYYKDKIKGKVFVAIVNVNNKRYRKIVGYENDEYRTNETIALLKKEKMKEEILNEIYVSSSNEYNFNTLWDIYIESIKPTYATKTIKNKENAYNVYFKNHFGNLKLNTIKNLHIQKFANKLLKSKAPKTIQNIRHAWNRILATANINKKMRIHDLRHLIGEVSLNNVNSSLEIVAAILGQTTTSATKRYAKVQRKVASQGLKKVFDYLKE